MGKLIMLTGKRYGRLTVVGIHHKAAPGKYFWECLCDCGGASIVAGMHLRSGNTTSCGCRKRTVLPEATLKHGHAREGGRTGTYTSWKGMRNRCNNPCSTDYALYGGRGISVCDRWSDFAAFLADMGERPDGHSIERVDPDGNYEPGNCVWLPMADQAKNQRRTKRYPFQGQQLLVREIAEKLGVSAEAFRTRIKKLGYVEAVRRTTHQPGFPFGDVIKFGE